MPATTENASLIPDRNLESPEDRAPAEQLRPLSSGFHDAFAKGSGVKSVVGEVEGAIDETC